MSDRDTSSQDARRDDAGLPPEVGPDHADTPAEASTRRLGDALSREVAEVRVQLREASLRSDAHALSGNLRAAIAARAEQRAILQEFEVRLRRKVAEAAVEREVEGVLRRAVDGGGPDPEQAPAERAAGVEAPRSRTTATDGDDRSADAVPLRQLPAVICAVLAFTAAVAVAAPGGDAAAPIPSGAEPAADAPTAQQPGGLDDTARGDDPTVPSETAQGVPAARPGTARAATSPSSGTDGSGPVPDGLLAGLADRTPSRDDPAVGDLPDVDVSAPDTSAVTDAVPDPPSPDPSPPPVPEEPDSSPPPSPAPEGPDTSVP